MIRENMKKAFTNVVFQISKLYNFYLKHIWKKIFAAQQHFLSYQEAPQKFAPKFAIDLKSFFAHILRTTRR